MIIKNMTRFRGQSQKEPLRSTFLTISALKQLSGTRNRNPTQRQSMKPVAGTPNTF
jgi:hypothetical protein